MKITCHSCQSKYTIADDKVLGKVVKIRCKKCATTIVVNGTDGASDGAPMSATPASLGAHGFDDSWTVSVTEADQRNMSEAEVVTAFRGGTIDAETFCWKDGMSDWLPLGQIEGLYGSCIETNAGATAQTAVSPARRVANSPGLTLEGTPAVTSSAFSEGGSGQAAPAARLAGGRAPAADLFGGFARAGGEDDVLTSVPAKMPDAHEAQTLTGARNESSVLFSLSALTGGNSAPPPPNEASGLIDIRQLSAQIVTEDKKKSHVDDIMNLSGGGAFSPTLIAPILTSPMMGDYSSDVAAEGSAGSKSSGLIGKAVGAGLAVVALAIGAAVFMMRDHGGATKETTPSASAAPSAAPEPSQAILAAAAPSDVPREAPAASASVAAAPSEPAPSASAAIPAVPDSKPAGTLVASSKEPTSKDAPAPRATKAEPAVEAGPFNLSEARSRLSAASAGAAGCKKSGGPTGTGHVVIVFAPSGGTQSVSVAGAPFEGTSTGACVAARFRAVRVPPFGGSPFSVSKSFSIN